jgi:hypothetical protein
MGQVLSPYHKMKRQIGYSCGDENRAGVAVSRKSNTTYAEMVRCELMDDRPLDR